MWGHANQEDMWRAHRLLDALRQHLCVHVISFEYPVCYLLLLCVVLLTCVHYVFVTLEYSFLFFE